VSAKAVISTRHPYGQVSYAAAIAEAQGWDVEDVPEWRTAMLLRPIPGDGRDAAGPYPRAAIPRDADLAGGLERLRGLGLVSAVLVPDPLFASPGAAFAAAFPLCRPFKTHFVVDRAAGGYAPSKHHRYEIRRAHGRCAIEAVQLGDHLADWTRLYAGLAERHEIRGPAAFSEGYFALLASDPTYETFTASVDGGIVAMAIWFEHEGVAVNHLGASDSDGYAAGASYGLYDAAIQHYAQCGQIDLGGAAGVADAADDGLARFKRGFANAEAVAYLCGAVLDPIRYAKLVADRPPSAFFPAYRA
jgi:hypothetical protein